MKARMSVSRASTSGCSSAASAVLRKEPHTVMVGLMLLARSQVPLQVDRANGCSSAAPASLACGGGGGGCGGGGRERKWD